LKDDIRDAGDASVPSHPNTTPLTPTKWERRLSKEQKRRTLFSDQ
jgi:hypothetical protein